MAEVVSSSSASSSCSLVSTSVQQNQPVYRNETWHTDRVLIPHMQHHNIAPVSFAAPSVGDKSNGVGEFGDFEPNKNKCKSVLPTFFRRDNPNFSTADC